MAPTSLAHWSKRAGASGAKDRGNLFVNGHNGHAGLVEMPWYDQLLLRLRPRPPVPHHQHDKPRQGGTHEPNRDPLIFRQAQYAINPAHGNPF
jgi:hypothetical protein